MCTCKWLSPFILATAVLFCTEMTLAGPNLGRDVTPAEIAAWDMSIPPDGSGLPAGGGTAVEGAAVYNAHCAACHGANGTGGPHLRQDKLGFLLITQRYAAIGSPSC